MLKRFSLAFAGLFAFVQLASGAGTVPGISMTQQLDQFAHPLSGGQLYTIVAGTTSTPQNCYQDTALTLPWPNPITLDATGRAPQIFCADGNIKIRLTDRNGVTQLVQDNLLVIGPSGGGGGGGTVDPTTILTTGDLKVSYGTGVLSGFVRANGRTIGSATSGATERANLDCQPLFLYLWGADANLAVSGGRGVSAAADWAANKTIALPDGRGRVVAGLDDMGNAAAGRLTAAGFGAAGTTLGLSGGGETVTLTLAQLPTGITAANASQAISVNSSGGVFRNTPDQAVAVSGVGGFGFQSAYALSGVTSTGNNSISVTSNNTSGAAHRTVQPTMLATIYVKL